jgi:prepilin-type N-terminal cleavage/methylation domain-containing protein
MEKDIERASSVSHKRSGGTCRGHSLIEMLMVLAMIAIFIGALCVPSGKETRTPSEELRTTGSIFFRNAGVELELVGEWLSVREAAYFPSNTAALCLPVLQWAGTNKDSVIELYRSSRLVDLARATKAVKEAIEAESGVLQDSITVEDFRSRAGVEGRKLSYEYRSEGREHGRRMRAECYVCINKRGRGVLINHIALADNKSDFADQTVRSLRLRNPSEVEPAKSTPSASGKK